MATHTGLANRFDGGVTAIPMAYEPGTSECRVLISCKGQIETMLLELAKLEHTEAIREQLVAVHNRLEALHDERRRAKTPQAATALL